MIDKFVVDGVAWQSLHDVTLSLFVGERDSWDHVCAKVDTKNCNGAKWEWDIGYDEQKKRWNLWNVASQCVRDRLLEVVKNKATFAHNRLCKIYLWRGQGTK